MRWVISHSYILTVTTVATLFLLGCTHLRTLSPAEVDQLTTCNNTSLKEIRKSLLLSGYEIKDQTATELVTNFKQVGGYEGRQTLRRITVVETGPKSYKFVVRLKSVQHTFQDSPANYRTPLNTVPAPPSAININLAPSAPVENEYDPGYIEGNLQDNRLIQSEVCGRK